MAEEHDEFLKNVFGADVSQYTTASFFELPPAREGHEKPGLFDVPLHALGKLVGKDDWGNPNRTFTEDVMHNSVEKFQGKEGDGTGMLLAKAAGIVVTMPLWGPAVVDAAVADHANQILNDFAEIGTKINNTGGDGQSTEAVQAQPAPETAPPEPPAQSPEVPEGPVEQSEQ